MAQSDILKFLEKNKGKSFTAREINKEINGHYNSIMANLQKLRWKNLVAYSFGARKIGKRSYRVFVYEWLWG